MPPAEASIPTCAACGAPLPVDPTAASVRCAHCGVVVAIDDRLRARMRAYVDHTRRAQREDLVARRLAAAHAGFARTTTPLLVGTIGFAVLCALLVFLVPSGAAAKLPLAVDVALVALVVASLVVLGWGFGVMVENPSLARLRALGSAQCERCGGFVAFPEGAPAARCPHCGGTALAPSAVAAALLDEVRGRAEAGRAAQRSAEAASAAEAKRASARIGVNTETAGSAPFVGVLLVVVSSVVTGGLVLVVRGGDGPATPTAWMWPTIGVATAATVAWIVRATKRSIAARQAMEAELGFSLMPDHVVPPRA
jgi:predicted RNA-binding Zn-ribbon protein involved in translation (DUF1610 family)